jgi:predicted transposase YbfD/YdcC
MGAEESAYGSIGEHFNDLEDPRMERTKHHQLLDIIAIAICGVICGADSWVDLELFGRSKEEWLKRFLSLPNGIPSHDTFGRVIALLDPAKFAQCFTSWVKAVSQLTQGQVIAIDGKALRRSHDRANGKSAIHMVSAWASANHLVLGQLKVDDKSNEITAIPELLEVLELSGCIVTIDAMGCQKDIARQIVEQGADYVLALKENQGQLYREVTDTFKSGLGSAFEGLQHDFYQTVGKGHGRIETRQCWVVSEPEVLEYLNEKGAWAGLSSVAMVRSKRVVGDEESVESRYYLSSLQGEARQLLEATRTHWEIENCVHWVLDIAFNEDDSRVRQGHAPQNLAVVRHLALNLLKMEQTSKGGVKARRKRAGWDEDYLLKVLSQLRCDCPVSGMG